MTHSILQSMKSGSARVKFFIMFIDFWWKSKKMTSRVFHPCTQPTGPGLLMLGSKDQPMYWTESPNSLRQTLTLTRSVEFEKIIHDRCSFGERMCTIYNDFDIMLLRDLDPNWMKHFYLILLSQASRFIPTSDAML